MANTLGVVGGPQVQGSAETITWGCDFSPQLVSGDSLGSPVTTLTDAESGIPYATGLVGSPSVSGTKILQKVRGLEAGHSYYLVFQGSGSPSGNVQVARLQINCPW